MIRQAQITDMRETVALGQEYFASSRYSKYTGDYDQEHATTVFRACVVDPLKYLDVLDIDDTVCGFCLTVAGQQAWSSNLMANINLLYITPEHQNSGWSDVFVERAVAWAQQHNMDEVICGDYAVSPDLFQRLTRRWDFEPQGFIASRRLNA